MVYADRGDAQRQRAAIDDLQRTAPHYRIPEFVKPQPSSPAAYKTFYEEKYLPLWRKAGLME
jgi:hypothetical protein